MRISQRLFDKLIPSIAFSVDQSVKEAVALRVFDPMIQITLFLVAKCLAVADQEFKITRVGLVGSRVVNLIDDPMTEGEPQATAFRTSCPKAILRAGGPARFNSRRAKRYSVESNTHVKAVSVSVSVFGVRCQCQSR